MYSQCHNLFEVLVADSQMAPWKMAPMTPPDAELDVEPDCSFFSSSFRGLSRIQPYLLELLSATSAEHFAKPESERVTYVQQSVIEGSWALSKASNILLKVCMLLVTW